MFLYVVHAILVGKILYHTFQKSLIIVNTVFLLAKAVKNNNNQPPYLALFLKGLIFSTAN